MEDLFSTPDDQQAGLYIPLAMNNLVPIVSSGLVRPMQLYGKYYVDTLSLRPDVIPLLRQRPGESILSLCESEGRSARSVIIEIEGLPDLLAASGTTELIPARHIRRVHCRSEEEATELTGRAYETAIMSDLPITVSPRLFSGDGIGLETLRQQIAQIPPGPAQAAGFADAAQRLTGGLLAVAGLGADLEVEIAQLLHGLLNGEWVSAESSALRMITDTLQGHSHDGADGRLLHVLITTLAALPLDERPGTDRLLDRFRETSGRLYPDDDRLLKWIGRVSEVLITQQFRKGSDQGAPVVFGLLIHATRPALSDQLLPGKGWDVLLSSGEPHRDTLVIARFLTGLRAGRARMNVSDRNRELDILCAELESLAYGRPDHPLFQFRAADHRAETQDSAPTITPVDAAAIPVPYEDTTGQHAPTVAPAVTASSLEVVLAAASVPHGETGKKIQRDELRYQPALAYLRGWHDLITTKIILDSPTTFQVIPGSAGTVTLEFAGAHTLVRQITDPGGFEARSAEMPFTEAEYLAASALLADPLVKKTRRQPRSSEDITTQEKKRSTSKRRKASPALGEDNPKAVSDPERTDLKV